MKKRIKDICTTVSRCLLLNKLEQNTGPYPLIGAKGVMKYIDFYDYENNYISIIKWGAGVGRIEKQPAKSSILGTMQGLMPKQDIDIDWFYYCLKSLKLERYSSNTTVPNLYFRDYGNVFVDVPSYEKQKVIASELKRIDNMIINQEKQLELINELVKSRFVDKFGRIDNTSYPLRNINSLCEFVKDGTHQTPTYTDDSVNGYKFLSSKDVTSGVIDWSNIKYIPKELHEQLYKTIKPQKNDILLAKNGTTGTAALVDVDEVFDIYVSLALLRFKADNNPKYMLYAINNEDTKAQFDANLIGVGVPNLHLGKIKEVKLIVPPKDLQDDFVSFVETIDKSKILIQQQIKILQELLDKKMDEYFDN